MGLGNALYGEISFKDGRVVQSNYSDYRVMRIDAAPRAHPGAPGAERQGRRAASASPACRRSRPALANAIFAATGRRIRSLPVGGQLAPATA